MNESEENFDFEDKRLSLIDVSFEDDCLYNSPSRDFQIHQFSGSLCYLFVLSFFFLGECGSYVLV